MKDSLLIAQNIKKTIIYIDKIVDNFPNTEKALRDKIKMDSYELLEYVYLANVSEDTLRQNYQNKLICKIKMLDFYFKISLDKKYISYKKYGKVGRFLLSIIKQVYGWKKSETIK